MTWWRSGSKMRLITVASALLTILASDAFAQSKSTALADVIKSYLQSVVTTSERKILKPSNTKPLAFSPRCISRQEDRCKGPETTRKIRSAIVRNETNMLEFVPENVSLKVYLVDADEFPKRKRDYDKKYADGFNDSEDPDCALYYATKESEISNAVILISLDAPDFKQRACLATQYVRGQGLLIEKNKTFPELWNLEPNPLSKLSEQDFDKLVNRWSVYTYIQMCPLIKSGMTLEEVSAILRRNACLEGLALKD
jgi:hypothetical protein